MKLVAGWSEDSMDFAHESICEHLKHENIFKNRPFDVGSVYCNTILYLEYSDSAC